MYINLIYYYNNSSPHLLPNQIIVTSCIIALLSPMYINLIYCINTHVLIS